MSMITRSYFDSDLGLDDEASGVETIDLDEGDLAGWSPEIFGKRK